MFQSDRGGVDLAPTLYSVAVVRPLVMKPLDSIGTDREKTLLIKKGSPRA